MPTPKIAPIMPACHASKTLEQTVREIPARGVQKCIVVDDFSGDAFRYGLGVLALLATFLLNGIDLMTSRIFRPLLNAYAEVAVETFADPFSKN
jgi:hypothetical protein